MLFSRNWLRQYVELPSNTEELATNLTAAGLNVELLEQRGDDVLLEIEVTTNRPDCMNHLGLAREIAAIRNVPLRPPPVPEASVASTAAETVEVELEDPHDCPRYVAKIVRGVRVGESPDWLKERLEGIGLRPINNVVDITNFVLWETGQPLHAFDLATLEGGKIVVRRALQGERLVTLDGEERTLGPEILVIADARRSVALAGIMGGMDTEVGAETVDVLIESAHFDRRRVRIGARQLGMHTDASHRFERGTDAEGCLAAAERAARLMVELAGGVAAAAAVDRAPGLPLSVLAGTVDLDRLDSFAGARIPRQDAVRWLRDLGFRPDELATGLIRVEVPAWRRADMEAGPTGEVYEADLFEEVMRLYGFEKIASALPPVTAPDVGTSFKHLRRNRIRSILAGQGFAEAINFAFHSHAADQSWRAPRDGDDGPVALANPLSEQYSVLRRSLLPNLVECAKFNQRRGAPAVRLFELGHVFPGGAGAETETLALVVGGRAGRPWDRDAEIDLFELKGTLEQLAEHSGLRLLTAPARRSGFVEGTTSEVRLAGDEAAIGFLGTVADEELAYPVFAAELEVEAMPAAAPVFEIEPPSRYPGVAADFTLTHAVDVPWSEIEAAIRAMAGRELVSFGLKERYVGSGVPEGAVNTTVHFAYNAEDRSLTQEEVNERQSAMAEELERRFAWGKPL